MYFALAGVVARGEGSVMRTSAYMSIAKKSSHFSKEWPTELNSPESTSQKLTASLA